jgi:site-specific DNA recombinase
MDEIEILKQENQKLKKELDLLKSRFDCCGNRGEIQKKGMIKKFSQGKHMSRVPFGYSWDFKNKILIPAQNSKEIEEIFEEFLQLDLNLSKLSKKHNLSVNGLKKILRNFVYIGKVKFDGQIHEGEHSPLISSTLFNKVQDKLDRSKIK